MESNKQEKGQEDQQQKAVKDAGSSNQKDLQPQLPANNLTSEGQNKSAATETETPKQKSEDNVEKTFKGEEQRGSLTRKLFGRKTSDEANESKVEATKKSKMVQSEEAKTVVKKDIKSALQIKDQKRESNEKIAEQLQREQDVLLQTIPEEEVLSRSTEIKRDKSERKSLKRSLSKRFFGRKRDKQSTKPHVHVRVKPAVKHLQPSEEFPEPFVPLVKVKDESLESFPRPFPIHDPYMIPEPSISTGIPSIMSHQPTMIYMAKEQDRPSVQMRPPYSELLSSHPPHRRGSKLTKRRSLSAADLTKRDIAICFFPEEPDWEWDEIPEDFDYMNRPSKHSTKRSSIFPEPLSVQDWTKRDRWESRLIYIIALVTYSISFSNIYNFPALVYFYGGMPFLIPYTIFTIILGYPLHFLESSLGQYSQTGPVRVWDSAPIARGVGWAMFLFCLGVAYYYNMYAAYSVIYFARCFNKLLPWQDCDEPANPLSNYSCVPRMCARLEEYHYTPAEHYFYDHVLQIRFSQEILSNGLGPMVWSEVLGFFLAWTFIYFAIIQGVRSIGKVVFFLLILPYFVLFMLLTAGLLLEGSSRGLYILFGTNLSRLMDIQVWRSAAEQIFFELGICHGIPMAYASYCRHLNPTHIDSAIVCTVNYFTSILCAVVVFNILGALSLEMGIDASDVIRHDPGMIFITYPEALSRVSGSHFWCLSFFLMLFSIAIGTQIAIMETAMTVVYDEFYSAKPFRWLINLLICCCMFLIGIILCTSNGYFVVYLLDNMTGTMPRMPIAVCMVVTIVLIYGISKYCEDMHFMLNYYPNLFMRLCFMLTPFLLIALAIPSWYLLGMKPVRVRGHEYTNDAYLVGWFSIWFIMIWIPLGAMYWVVYCYYMGRLKDIWKSLNAWGPRSYSARIARAEFTSDDVYNFTRSWSKKVEET